MIVLGALLPEIQRPPGAATRAWIDRLAAVECPAITSRRSRRGADNGGRDPIVWAEAVGANVVDVEGNRYVDLSSGFGVAGIGHRHPKVVEAVRAQSDRLVHAMGDLFPSQEKITLGERIAERTPGDLQHSILGANGGDAIEAAIKSAMVATGKSRVLAFGAGYHGMSLGALGVSGYRDAFRRPFSGFAGAVELRLPFPSAFGSAFDPPSGPTGIVGDAQHVAIGEASLRFIRHLLAHDTNGAEDIAGILVEPIQGRGGILAPPPGWLPGLRALTEELGIALIFDEIYTGWGRTGDRFACDHEGVVPDILCIGKAMGGGVPISACVGRPWVMHAWGESAGEGIHTSTFLGNPLNCAAANAALDVIESEDMVGRSARLGARMREALIAAIDDSPRVAALRGRGSMLGVALQRADGSTWPGGGVQAMYGLLERGFITSPSGAAGEVIGLSPPFVLTDEQADAAVDAIADWLRQAQPE